MKAERVYSYQAYSIPHAVAGLDGEGNIVLEFWDGAGTDQPCCIRLRMKRWPTGSEVADIELALDLLSDFRFGALEPVFRCRKCGREVHWLDIEPERPGIRARAEMLLEEYCGC